MFKNLLVITTAIYAICCAHSSAIAADNKEQGVIKASCVEKGVLIYREDLPYDTPADVRMFIVKEHPKALCVFVQYNDKDEIAPEENVATKGIPDEIANLNGGDNDIVKALAYVEGNTNEVTSYSPDMTDNVSEFFKTKGSFSNKAEVQPDPKKTSTINLTVGVFKNSEPEDITKYWQTISDQGRIIGKYQPKIEKFGDDVLVSIEDVSTTEVQSVCDDAKVIASGCIAAY